MTRAWLVALAIAPALSACSTLPDVAADSCGNGIVESGEECDGDASAAGGTCGTSGDNACHFVCADGGPTCPTGYTCATDGRCRAPSAIFYAAAVPYAFDANDMATGDVDGDGNADLVGVSSSALTVRFGDDKADLFDGVSQSIRPPVTHAVFGDLDGDGHLDVLVPDNGGIFAFLAAGRGFNPYPYTSIQLSDQTSPVRVASVQVDGTSVVSQVLTFLANQALYLGANPIETVCIEGGVPPNCLGTHDVSDLVGSSIPLGRTGFKFGAFDPKDDTTEFVLAFKGADHVDLWSPTQPQKKSDGTYDLTTASVQMIGAVPLPKAGTLGNSQVRVAAAGAVAFGQLDDDGCVDLVIPTQRTEGLDKYEGIAIAYGSKNLGACTGKLDPATLVAEAKLDVGGSTKGLRPVAVADLDGDGLSDVVTNDLITVTVCTRQRVGCKNGVSFAWEPDFRGFTPREWTDAIATDINHDSHWDVAGMVAGSDDVDVMLNTGYAILNRFDVSTSLPPRFLRTGDFDGDLVLDLAIVLGDTTAGTDEDDQLAVVFGDASGGPSTPVSMGDFGIVEVAEPASMFTDLRNIDAITDLLVIANRAGTRGVAPLIGSSSRRLLAPYLLNEGTDTDPQTDEPVAVQMGDYDAASGKDVCALGRLVSTSVATNGGSTGPGTSDLIPHIFLLSGAGGGNLVGGDPIIPPGPIPNFEYRDAVWASGKLGRSDTLDSIVGIDATDDKRTDIQATAPAMFIATPPTVSGGMWTLSTPAALPSPYDGMKVHAIRLADLDGDGLSDLLIELVPAQPVVGAVIPSTTALVAWNKDGTLDVAHLSPVFPTGMTCHGAAEIQADLGPGLEIASICTDASGGMALTLFHWNSTTWAMMDGTFAVTGTAPTAITGDFNGDTVPDLAVVTGGGASSTAQVWVQCAAGDVACAAKATAPVAGK